MPPRSWIPIGAGVAVVGAVMAFLAMRPRNGEPDVSAAKAEPRPAQQPSPFEDRDRARPSDDANRRPAEDEATPIGLPMERPAGPAAAPQPPQPPPTLSEAGAKAKASADTAVDAIRSEMRSKCWNSLEGEHPDKVAVGFSLTVDAEGKVLSSSVSQDRGNYIPELGNCLAAFAHGLQLAPPGETVSVDVSFDLP